MTAPTRTLAVILLAGSFLVAPVGPHTAAAPSPDSSGPSSPVSAGSRPSSSDADLSNVDDMMDGKRVLLDVADLLLLQAPPISDTANPMAVALPTNYDLITTQQVWGTSFSCAGKLCDYQGGRCATKVPGVWPFPFRGVTGRLFDRQKDSAVVVSAEQGTSVPGAISTVCSDSWAGWWVISDKGTSSSPTYQEIQLTSDNNSGYSYTNFLQLAMADFNGDDFDDIFAVNPSSAFVVNAQDPSATNLNYALTFHPYVKLGGAKPVGDPTTGDFNGDGLMDVAWVSITPGCDDFVNDCVVSNLKVNFATVCPGNVTNTQSICYKQAAFTILLEPLSAAPITLAINPSGTSKGSQNQCPPAVALASGHFGSDATDLAVGAAFWDASLGHCNFQVRNYKFDPHLKSTQVGTTQTITYLHFPRSVFMATGRFDWFSGYDQLVIAAGGLIKGGDTDSHGSFVSVVDFSTSTQSMTLNTLTSNEDSYLGGLAVGLFADPPTNGSASASAYNPQFAVMVWRNGSNNQAQRIRLYKTEQNSQTKLHEPTLYSTFDLKNLGDAPADLAHPSGGSRLLSGDLEGRSVRVGNPDIVRVQSNFQPDMILPAPPMHVDYIQPAPDTAKEPSVVNFSAIPDGFNSQFHYTSSTNKTSTNTSTTDWSTGVAASVSEEAQSGTLDPVQVTAKMKSTTSSTHDNEQSVTETTYTSQSMALDITTGFDDTVWYTSNDFNVYQYPVIGQTQCPAAEPSCTDPTPLYMMLSGPDTIERNMVDGTTLEWYQPVHEVGQVFSYPGNQTQLTKRVPDIAMLNASTTGFATDGSSSVQSFNWTSSSSNDVTTATSNTFASSTEYSVSAGTPKWEEAEGGGFKVSASLDLSSSTALKNLHESQSTLAASSGIQVFKPGTFLTPNLYKYMVQPFIFGQQTPATADTVKLNATVKTNGVLMTEYTADPTNSSSGSWWASSPYKQAPDLAVNHPARWSRTSTGAGLNCLLTSAGTNDCFEANQPGSNSLWNTEFYWMKGLLVTVGSAADGPQRTSANAGDTVHLQARVYNYSMKDMGNAQAHIRFYRQPWSISDGTPSGDSVLIGEKVLGAIPAFSAANGAPDNYVTSQVDFDSTGLDSDWVFWVVVWAQNPDGTLMTELPGHGLSQLPGTLAQVTDAPLEQVNYAFPDGSTSGTFSNNVGLFKQAFTICPDSGCPTGSAQATHGPRSAGPSAGTMVVRNVKVTPSRAKVGERVIVQAEVISLGEPTEGVPVYFFDGDPQAGGRLFDVEILSYVRSDRHHLVSTPIRPETCGQHEIVVEAHKNAALWAHDRVMLDVPCDGRTQTVWLPAVLNLGQLDGTRR